MRERNRSQSSIAHFCLGRSYYLTGKPELVLENLKKAQKLTNTNRDMKYVMHLFTIFGLSYNPENIDLIEKELKKREGG